MTSFNYILNSFFRKKIAIGVDLMNQIIRFPGSKSLLIRVLLISTYLEKPLLIENASSCSDVLTMIDNLRKFGFIIENDEDKISIQPPCKFANKNKIFFIKDSATAFRFLLARMASITDQRFEITVSKQLQDRPMRPLIKILEQQGAIIDSRRFPFSIEGKKLAGGKVKLDASISSQFISALLLIAPSYENDMEIEFEGELVSASYLNMTIKLMRYFGINVIWQKDRIFLEKGQKYQNPEKIKIEPDYSSACYFWALGALSEKEICTEFAGNKFSQADLHFLKIIDKMGACVKTKFISSNETNNEENGNGNLLTNKICVQKKQLHGVKVNMKDMPDQVPTLSILALFAEEKTTISGIAHLRFKESDRIAALLSELKKLGVKIEWNGNQLTIQPLQNTENKRIILGTHQDHRLLMSFAILQTKFPAIQFNEKKSVEKSFPKFFQELELCKK